MLFTRKIGAALRGDATPLQVMLATLLGALLGFVPGFFLPGDLGGGFAQSPGLIVLLLCLALIANANLGVFGLTLVVSKLLSFALLPVSYAVGTFLLDGPLSGLFGALVNGKVTAWFGLEYYATTGGLVVGAVFGVALGWLVNRMLRAIRAHMAGVEQTSERYQKYAGRWWVRLLAWLFLGGGKGKQTWQQLSERKRQGLPFRLLGVLAAGVLVGGLWVFQAWFSAPLLRNSVRGGLEAVNGSTVDVGAASLTLADGTLRLEQLAISDSEALDEDLFAADELVATIDTGELLRRRFVIDQITSKNARSGTARATAGVRTDAPDEVEVEAEQPPAPEGTRTIEDYVQDYELWKGRLEQVRSWLEGMSGADEPADEPTPEDNQRQRERQLEAGAGLAGVVARHLLHEMPRVVIRNVDIEGIAISIDGSQDKLDLHLKNISDAPSLLADVMTGSLRAQSDKLKVGLTGPAPGGSSVGLDFAMRELSVDSLFGQLSIGGTPPVAGGTMDLAATGSFGDLADAATISLPLQVTMKGATFALGSMQPTKIDQLLLPIGLSGSLTAPVVSLDDAVLQKALLDAGQQELANFVQGQAGKLLGGAVPVDLQQAPGKIVEDAKNKIEDEAKKAAGDAARKLVPDGLPGGLRGLLPGGSGNKNEGGGN